jgi:twitching motility protein PilT
MEIFHRILQTAIEGGASDIHLKVNHPVVFRINRQLIAIQAPTPTADWLDTVVETMVPRHLKKRLDEEHEVDFSYYVPKVGRFRTNLFQQKGEPCLSMRYVKTKVPSFEDLGLLEILKRLAESPRGIVLLW